MIKNEIINKIQNIYEKRYCKNIEKSWAQVKDIPLLGYEMGIRPGELLHLFFDIEEEFNIKIPEKYIVNGEFNSLESIVNMVLDISRENKE